MTPLALRAAQDHLKTYSAVSDDLIAHHQEAMSCLDCEDFLRLGIDAFDWLMRADLSIRRAVYRGEAEYDQQLDSVVVKLLQVWLVPCDFALKWANEQRSRGFRVENLEQFEKCHREAAAMLVSDDEFFDSDKLVDLRDAALDEHFKELRG